ncbi:MAG TPA: alpha/beta fold hydrolase [Solirubrobacteraceae bacterium]|nr:alpha/beta fold hydrolase [Solirubrobacteraceae bacterium]
MSGTVARPPSAWLPIAAPPGAPLRLYCFPHSGAGTVGYRDWSTLAPDLGPVPVRLPGRESRVGEPPIDDLDLLVERLVDEVVGSFEPPYVLYGHSVGAIVAFELVRAQRRLGLPMPEGLVVSGRPAPQLRRRGPGMHLLSDEGLAADVLSLGGVPEQIAARPKLLAFFLPLLRADLTLTEGYRYVHEPPLDIPIAAFGGEEDPKAWPDEMAAWREQTTARFTVRVLGGGHFFPLEQGPALLRMIRDDVTEWLR